MALCGADFKFDVFLVIFAFQSVINRITTLAARIYDSYKIFMSNSINYFLSFGKKNFYDYQSSNKFYKKFARAINDNPFILTF